ncbi:MAG TPA: phosphoadenylyl-sulfate reductase [Malonomonas sp.]
MNQALDTMPQLKRLNGATVPHDILRKGLACIEGAVALASSFSIEDIVLIDLLQQTERKVQVFAIDTGRLPEETLEIAETIRLRYQLEIDWYFPERDAVEQLEREKGLFSFRESLKNRQHCCHIRKVEPLQRALCGLSGWITGQRREQGTGRGLLQPIEIDQTNGGIVKLNPLCYWSEAQLTAYVKQQRLPINRLHQQGYPSIGCAPCSRAVQPGEDPRAGRWWWENPEHKECGLHKRTTP